MNGYFVKKEEAQVLHFYAENSKCVRSFSPKWMKSGLTHQQLLDDPDYNFNEKQKEIVKALLIQKERVAYYLESCHDYIDKANERLYGVS